MTEWLKKNSIKRKYSASNEYCFGKDGEQYFKVYDFTFENGGYVLFCEDFEIENVTIEQIINFAKAFGLELR